jgi:hypothetical protein
MTHPANVFTLQVSKHEAWAVVRALEIAGESDRTAKEDRGPLQWVHDRLFRLLAPDYAGIPLAVPVQVSIRLIKDETRLGELLGLEAHQFSPDRWYKAFDHGTHFVCPRPMNAVNSRSGKYTVTVPKEAVRESKVQIARK